MPKTLLLFFLRLRVAAATAIVLIMTIVVVVPLRQVGQLCLYFRGAAFLLFLLVVFIGVVNMMARWPWLLPWPLKVVAGRSRGNRRAQRVWGRHFKLTHRQARTDRCDPGNADRGRR